MNQDFESLHSEPVPETTTPQGDGVKVKRTLLDVLETILISGLLFLAINAISARIRVDGSSMEPSLHSGEFIIVNKLAYKLGSPQLGDIIVFHFPRDPEQEYIKRVIGLPGDKVVVANGKVEVNGQVLDEEYLQQPPRYHGTWQVPEGHLFVLGDNRNNSSDSHDWGTVPLDYVVGKAVLVYWPVESWGLVDHISPQEATQ